MKKLTRIWNSISSIGIKAGMPLDLEKRIMLSNHLGLAIFLLASIFSNLYIVRGIFVPIPLIVLALVGACILIFNRLGAHSLSRFIVSVAPGIAMLMLNVMSKLTKPERIESFHYTNVRLLIAVTVLLPLTLFTFRERKPLVLGAAIIIGISFFLDPIFDFFGVGSETLGVVSVYKQTAIDDLIVLFTTLFLTFIFLIRLNIQLQKGNISLLDEAESSNQKLLAQQEGLQENLKKIENARKEEEARNHIATGLANFSDLIRSENNVANAYRPLLTALIQFVKANQGGLFIVQNEEENTFLQLAACYAYGRHKYFQKRIEPGDGLIGQCFLEQEPTHLHEVPNDYINITSGLGEARPANIFIMPLKTKNSIVGIIEIASFQALSPIDIEYLTKTGEHLASAIEGNRVHVKTQHLLEESRELSTKLMEKENEMRQNMEELEATQETMARKEAEYQARIAQLEKQIEKRPVTENA